MNVKNNLKKVLEELGIKSMIPTEELLKKLGHMTPHRFNKILNNSSPQPLTAVEADAITRWLARMTGQPVTSIQLIDHREVKEEVAS
jgi:hypothetical protein